MFTPEQEKEYDFMEMGLSKKNIQMKREMAILFKKEFKIPENIKIA